MGPGATPTAANGDEPAQIGCISVQVRAGNSLRAGALLGLAGAKATGYNVRTNLPPYRRRDLPRGREGEGGGVGKAATFSRNQPRTNVTFGLTTGEPVDVEVATPGGRGLRIT